MLIVLPSIAWGSTAASGESVVCSPGVFGWQSGLLVLYKIWIYQQNIAVADPLSHPINECLECVLPLIGGSSPCPRVVVTMSVFVPFKVLSSDLRSHCLTWSLYHLASSVWVLSWVQNSTMVGHAWHSGNSWGWSQGITTELGKVAPSCIYFCSLSTEDNQCTSACAFISNQLPHLEYLWG